MLASDAGFVCVGGAGQNAFSCFLLSQETSRQVGPFDQEFWPAYVEDSDYSYRMTIAGVRCEAVECDGFRHVGSATKEAGDDAFKNWINSRWGENHAYYMRKWGGPVGHEVWTTPFNGVNA
jgi:GT2 family glycosyltransferase